MLSSSACTPIDALCFLAAWRFIRCEAAGLSLERQFVPQPLHHPKSVNRMRYSDDISKVSFPPFISPLLARIFSLTGKNFFPDWENNFL
jgi:hypothetical protein